MTEKLLTGTLSLNTTNQILFGYKYLKQSIRFILSMIVLNDLDPAVPLCKFPQILSKLVSKTKLKSPPKIMFLAPMKYCEKEFRNSNRSDESDGK